MAPVVSGLVLGLVVPGRARSVSSAIVTVGAAIVVCTGYAEN